MFKVIKNTINKIIKIHNIKIIALIFIVILLIVFIIENNIGSILFNRFILPFNLDNNHKIESTAKKTLSWYLEQGSWREDSILVREDDGSWTHNPSNSANLVTFLPNNKLTIYRDGKLIGDGYWSVDESSSPPVFNFSGEIIEIEKIDQETLIFANYNVECLTCLNKQQKNAAKIIYSHH